VEKQFLLLLPWLMVEARLLEQAAQELSLDCLQRQVLQGLYTQQMQMETAVLLQQVTQWFLTLLDLLLRDQQPQLQFL
jgi:hypothetical protein